MSSMDVVEQLSDENFDSAIAEGVVLVDFYAEWCGPCRMLAPIVKELAITMKDKINVAKVDIDNAVDVSRRLEVASIPTIMIFKDGKLAKKSVGLKDLESLQDMVNEVLAM